MDWGNLKQFVRKCRRLRFQLFGLLIALFLLPSQPQADVERVIDYEYDGAGNIVRIITQEQSAPPIILQLSPNFVNAGRSASITATGSNLLGADVTTDVPGLSINNVNPSVDQVTFQLTASDTTAIGNAILRFSNGIGETLETIFIAEISPALTTIPNPVAIAHSNTTTSVSLVFSEPRLENETYTLTTDDASIADTVATSFTILAGETQVDIALTGFAIGSTNLNIDLVAKFYAYSFPVFVGKSYEELLAEFPDMLQRNLFATSVGVLLQDDTKYIPGTVSQVVGVVVGGHSGISLKPVGIFYGEGFAGRLMTGPVGVNLNDNIKLVYSRRIGTIFGPLVDAIQPTVVAAGSTDNLQVSGVNLHDVLNISLTPNTDITVDGFTVNLEGTQITLTLTIDPIAALGEREISLQDGTGVLQTRSGNPLKIDIQ